MKFSFGIPYLSEIEVDLHYNTSLNNAVVNCYYDMATVETVLGYCGF